MKLLRTFPKFAFDFGLASWHWVGLRDQTPRFATCFGDVFLESLDGWWFLDTIEGTLELRWTSAVTMYAELEPPEGRANYLMDDLVREARSRGIHLGDEDIYTFNPHPALGGELGADNLDTMRFELALNWVGQMHDQVLHASGEIDLPPMPADGRRTGTAKVAQAWDAAWARDETFDVPFEDYLATSTFAAVATPIRHDDGHPVPSAPRHGEIGERAYAPQDHAEPWAPASYPTERARPWPTEQAQPWPEQAPEQFETGPAGQQPGLDPPHQQPGWATHDVTQHTADDTDGSYLPSEQTPGRPEWNDPGWNDAGWDSSGQDGPGWVTPDTPEPGSPTWAAPGWGGTQQGDQQWTGQQEGQRTDVPFTAWEDLWGSR